MGYLIKQKPEDFVVEEIMDLASGEKGPYSYFLLEKKDFTTQRAIELIAKKFHIPYQQINFSGTKDKVAVTKQYISILRLPYGLRKDHDFDQVRLTYLGQGNQRLNLGMHQANRFIIVVRDIENPQIQKAARFPNYFGPQRFSTKNHKIGILVLQNRWREALQEIKMTKSPYVETFEKFEATNNIIGALRQLPKKIFMFYLNAFQSLLWNIMLSEFLQALKLKGWRKKQENDVELFFPSMPKQIPIHFPMMGFDWKEAVEAYKQKLAHEFREAYDLAIAKAQAVLADYSLTAQSFVLRPFQLLMETQWRKGFAEIKALTYKIEDDELFPGKKKITFSFILPKSAYATIALEQLLPPGKKNHNP